MMFILMIGKHPAVKQTSYGQEKQFSVMDRTDQTSSNIAMASKARPGPHRDKREAKKEAKASKFRGVDHAVKSKAGVMAKAVNLVRYDMSDFLGSCVENFYNLAKVNPSSLKEVPTPFTDAGIARPTLSEDEKPGKLQPVASKILMKILFAA